MTKVPNEFQRVQTWLFAVPRLRPKVRASALLGELRPLHADHPSATDP